MKEFRKPTIYCLFIVTQLSYNLMLYDETLLMITKQKVITVFASLCSILFTATLYLFRTHLSATYVYPFTDTIDANYH